MTRRTPRIAALALALAAAALTACSGGGHAKPTASPARPQAAPSGPCRLTPTVTCTKGVLPLWTLAQLRSRLLTKQDVLPTMTHPYDPQWWGETVYSQYAKRQSSGNYVPSCHYVSLILAGPSRTVSAYNYLWSDVDPTYPKWPRESITQFAYVYTDPAVQAKDITTIWNHECKSGDYPRRTLLNGGFLPPEKDVDQVTSDLRDGWAHLRVVERKFLQKPGNIEEDVFDYLQNGNVLITSFMFEQYTTTPKDADWARTLSHADLLLGKQLAKLTTPQ